MTHRIPTGIPNLDSAIEGGFPEGSLILLSGAPGTGKTVFGMKFLLYGASCCGEPGVLASFSEGKKALTENMINHFKCGINDFEDVEILDFVAVKEKGLESAIEMIIRSIDLKEARRLVIDSFTAMTTGVEEKVDARILAYVLGKLVKQTKCTTILVAETSIGTDRIGTGVEEFVADGVIVLNRRIQDGRNLREMDILKLRGTRIKRPRHLFTLENGFHVFPKFTFKMPEQKRRFKPRPDTEMCFSSGSRDLDELLGGGWRRGSVNLIEAGPRIEAAAPLNLIFTTAQNFVLHGNGFLIFDPLICDANTVKEYLELFIGEDGLNQLVRCVMIGTPSSEETENFILNLKGEKHLGDAEAIFKALDETGLPDKPVYRFVSLDALASYCKEGVVRSVVAYLAQRTRTNSLLVLSAFANFERSHAVSNMSATHLRLEEMNGAAVMYGIKPETGYYVMEIDTSKGYPDLKLTPIL